MKHCWGGEGAGGKVYCWSRGAGMKALKSLEGGTEVKGEDFKFTGCEAECGQATEHLG